MLKRIAVFAMQVLAAGIIIVSFVALAHFATDSTSHVAGKHAALTRPAEKP